MLGPARVKISLYIEHGSGDGVGGAELLLAFLASAWSREHDVTLVHHRQGLTRERFERFTTDDLSRVTLMHVPRQAPPDRPRSPFARYRAAEDWHRAVSDGCDVFVNCTHWLPCFCHAPVGVLLVLFPIYIRPEFDSAAPAVPVWKRPVHSLYHSAEWAARMRGYRHFLAISEFTRAWTVARWNVECDVVYPPVDVAFDQGHKENLIVSVGRFATLAHRKHQLELVTRFRQLHASNRLGGWRFACVGGLNSRRENIAYFHQVEAAASGCPAQLGCNVSHGAIRSLFARARVFWHATGLDDDTEHRPELAEHFGIATVEAMAAGCVPVVINKGGQPELVQHGVNGFLWNTLAELESYTQLLAHDEALWARMSAAARERASRFTRARFVAEMSERAGVAGATTGRPAPTQAGSRTPALRAPSWSASGSGRPA